MQICVCFWQPGDSYGAENWTPEAALIDQAPKSYKTYGKVCKYGGPGVPFGARWAAVGPAREILNHLGSGFGATLGSVGSVFSNFLSKNVTCYFDATLQRNGYLCWSRRSSWIRFGTKVTPERPKVVPKGQIREARTVLL